MNTYAYVGCRTTKERNARGKGIKVFQIQENKEWKLTQLVENLVNPSYFCFDQKQEYLYSIHGDFSEISAFKINPDNGHLIFQNTVSTGGINPVHLSVDKENRWVFVANLQTGTVAVIPRNEDGTISHPHQVTQDGTGQYLIVSCQGRKQGFGQVNVFQIDSEEGTLEKTCVVKSREIAEPRHFVFHPNNRWGYGVNEKDYSVTFYHFDEKAGVLEARQIVPTLPDDYTGDGWASGIVMDKSGTYLYVSNRKHDSVSGFQINQDSGKLTYISCVKTRGEQPRFITLDFEGKKLVAANEVTDTIIEFHIEPETGILVPKQELIETESPVCVLYKG